jgi:hypothetical protein
VKGARRFERTANSTLREKRAWMFGKWTRDSGQEHVSGYDASPPSSSYRSNPQAPPYKQSSYGSQQVYEPQPPSFGEFTLSKNTTSKAIILNLHFLNE